MINNIIEMASLNVRETFNWLKSKHFAIYLLEEFHCLEKTETPTSGRVELH